MDVDDELLRRIRIAFVHPMKVSVFLPGLLDVQRSAKSWSPSENAGFLYAKTGEQVQAFERIIVEEGIELTECKPLHQVLTSSALSSEGNPFLRSFRRQLIELFMERTSVEEGHAQWRHSGGVYSAEQMLRVLGELDLMVNELEAMIKDRSSFGKIPLELCETSLESSSAAQNMLQRKVLGIGNVEVTADEANMLNKAIGDFQQYIIARIDLLEEWDFDGEDQLLDELGNKSLTFIPFIQVVAPPDFEIEWPPSKETLYSMTWGGVLQV